MESYQKIFADDLNSGKTDAHNNGILALSGRNISKCLVCGALTEIPDMAKPVMSLSLYDPTGMLVVGFHTGNREISAFLNETSLPVFVLCTGAIRCNAGNCLPMAESIVPVSRAVRDTFVVAAAADLIEHLEHSPDTSPDLKKRLCGMAEKALATVITENQGPVTPDDAVIEQVDKVIREISDDKNTVSVDVLIATLGEQGVSREIALAVLKTMINDGDCYQPKPDIIRLL